MARKPMMIEESIEFDPAVQTEADAVRAEIEKRGLSLSIDTSDGAEIHVAQYKSYHTTTPNGYNLQISWMTRDKRLALANAVKPKGY